MKLYITRDQAKALLGGVKFELRAKVVLTPQEEELVKRYQAWKEVLIERRYKIPFTERELVIGVNIDGLVRGQTFKSKDITELLEHEKNVKDACDMFKKYIEVMKHFGGEEVIEY